MYTRIDVIKALSVGKYIYNIYIMWLSNRRYLLLLLLFLFDFVLLMLLLYGRFILLRHSRGRRRWSGLVASERRATVAF